jgi:hypothetical protein
MTISHLSTHAEGSVFSQNYGDGGKPGTKYYIRMSEAGIGDMIMESFKPNKVIFFFFYLASVASQIHRGT